MQCSVDLATQLQMQRSDSSKHSLVVAKLALHLPLLDVQLVYNLSGVVSHARPKGFRSQGQLVTSTSQPATNGQSATLESQPATSSMIVPTTTSNESHTRFNELRALAPDPQPTVAITRGQATTVLSEDRNKEQRKRTQWRSATMFAVNLLCVLRATLCLTPAMGCARMDDHRACRVTSVHTVNDDYED